MSVKIRLFRAKTKNNYVIIQGFLQLLDGLIKVVTIGFFCSNFGVNYILKKKSLKN